MARSSILSPGSLERERGSAHSPAGRAFIHQHRRSEEGLLAGMVRSPITCPASWPSRPPNMRRPRAGASRFGRATAPERIAGPGDQMRRSALSPSSAWVGGARVAEVRSLAPVPRMPCGVSAARGPMVVVEAAAFTETQPLIDLTAERRRLQDGYLIARVARVTH